MKKPIGDGPSMPVMPNGTPSDHDKEIASSPKRPEGFVTPAATPARGKTVSLQPFHFVTTKKFHNKSIRQRYNTFAADWPLFGVLEMAQARTVKM